MPLYEHVFLARQDLSQSQVDALAATATEIVEANQGKVTKTETWGLRSLAYKIQKNRKAHFVLLNIEAPAGVVAELERQTSINEDIIRFLTVRVDELETGPSVMMRKNDRERSRRREREGNNPWPVRFSAAARAAPSRARTLRRSTTRTCACFRVSCPNVARSSPAASPRFRPRSSVS
jgi:small subunit ribosomal protein S6